MAIGKVNAYATVDAPKVDFGAVAQMNIDNLVKSVKEDEQAKAVKKAAAEKAKAERVTEDLPVLIATGNYAHDEFLTGEIIKQRKFHENFDADWRENDNYKSKVAAERIVSNIKNLNNQLTIEAETIKRTSALAGGNELNKAYADKIMSLTQKERRYTQNEKGEAFTGFYKDNGDGTATLEDEYAYSDYMVMMSNPVVRVDIPTVMGKEAETFEKTLTETSDNYTTHEGVKKLSDKALASIDAMAKGKMEDSDFVFNYMIEKGYTPDKNAFLRKFDPKLKNELAGMYAEEIKGRIGEERTISRTAAQQPREGSGGKEKGYVNVDVNSSFDVKGVIKNGVTSSSSGLIGFTSTDAKNEMQIPVGSKGYSLTSLGVEKTKDLDMNIGGAIITPTTLYMTPGGRLIAWGQNAVNESESMSLGIEKEGEVSKVKNANFAFSHDKNARDFDNLMRGIVNTEPTWEVKDKRGNVVQRIPIRSQRDIKLFFNNQNIQDGGKGLIGFSRKASTGTQAKAKAGAKKGVGSKYN